MPTGDHRKKKKNDTEIYKILASTWSWEQVPTTGAPVPDRRSTPKAAKGPPLPPHSKTQTESNHNKENFPNKDYTIE